MCRRQNDQDHAAWSGRSIPQGLFPLACIVWFGLRATSSVKQFSRLDPSDIRGVNSNECDRRTATIDEFNFVCDAAPVNVNNGADITAIQFLVFGFSIEYDEGVFCNHSSSSG
jgi:hypothetical protein